MDSSESICRTSCGLHGREGEEGTTEEMNRRDERERERVDSVLVRSATNRHELTGVHQLQDCEVCLLADRGEGDVGEAWRHSWAVQPQQEMLQVLSL